MCKEDERYQDVQKFANNLKSISHNLQIIALQDSLLDLSKMSEQDLEKFALGLAKSRAEQNATKQAEGDQLSVTTSVLAGNSRFFAYNPASTLKGKQDFSRRWGDRPLEDNWRRSNKASSLLDQEETEIVEEEVVVDYTDEVNKIISQIPISGNDQDDAKKRIENALFELGTGFRSYLENFTKSNETLLTLLRRFPQTEHKVEAYYYLHLNYLNLDNQAKATEYRNRILSEFADSPFAIYLKNPNDENALMTEEKKIQLYYENTYEEFENGKYQLVFDRIERAREEFGQEHKMAAKYDLLRAMAIGNTSGQKEYVNALRGVILKYNNTPEQTYAREMMRFLRGDEDAFGNEVDDTDLSKFKIEEDKLHYVIFLLYGGDGNAVNELKNDLNKYNQENFPDWRLRSTSTYLNQEKRTHLVLLRRYSDAAQAMEYYNSFKAEADKVLDPAKFSYDIFAVNQLNYREIITSKSTNAYRLFFEKNYLNKTEDR